MADVPRKAETPTRCRRHPMDTTSEGEPPCAVDPADSTSPSCVPCCFSPLSRAAMPSSTPRDTESVAARPPKEVPPHRTRARALRASEGPARHFRRPSCRWCPKLPTRSSAARQRQPIDCPASRLSPAGNECHGAALLSAWFVSARSLPRGVMRSSSGLAHWSPRSATLASTTPRCPLRLSPSKLLDRSSASVSTRRVTRVA